VLVFAFSAFMAIVSLALLTFSLLAPTHWADFIEWEHAIAVRMGVPRAFSIWTKRHELGASLKIILALLATVSIACAVLSFYQ